MSIGDEYRKKVVSSKQVAQMVKNGDRISYAGVHLKPAGFDRALAARREELSDVTVHALLTIPPVPEVLKHPEAFTYRDWHFGKINRVMQAYGIGYYSPVMFHQVPMMRRSQVFAPEDFFILRTAPMNEKGFFNFGIMNGDVMAEAEMARKVVVEIVRDMPVCLGGDQEALPLSMVDYVIEDSQDEGLYEIVSAPPGDTEVRIAAYVMEHIHDGCCIQLGIGGLPNAIGHMIAASDLKNLGGHTEMLCDAFIEMIESGVVNGANKNFDRRKVCYTFAAGSKRLYDFMHMNTSIASFPVDYINHPRTIAAQDNFISVCSALEVDLFSQVNAESSGSSQIAGNGGLSDFVIGSEWSKGGKSLICLPATYKDKDGQLHSNIRARFAPGSVTTVPRQLVDWVVTEFGAAHMRAKSTWERAEGLIGLAHPDFREELIAEAEAMKIWRRSSKIA